MCEVGSRTLIQSALKTYGFYSLPNAPDFRHVQHRRRHRTHGRPQTVRGNAIRLILGFRALTLCASAIACRSWSNKANEAVPTEPPTDHRRDGHTNAAFAIFDCMLCSTTKACKPNSILRITQNQTQEKSAPRFFSAEIRELPCGGRCVLRWAGGAARALIVRMGGQALPG